MKRFFLFAFLIILSYCAYSQPCTLSVNITSSTPAICSLNTVTLTATASAGTPAYNYAWNTGETTPSIGVNKAGTYTVTVTDHTPGCAPVVQSITLLNSVTPIAPTAADGATCPNGTATLTATAPGGTYQWYDSAVGGDLLSTGASFTTPPLTTAKTYYVETLIAQCASPRTAVAVAIVKNINVTGASVCSGNSATLSASGATNYQWFDAPTGGNLVSSSATFVTPVLNTTTIYYVVGSGNGCTSSPTPVTAIVTPTPQVPLTTNVSICSGSTATLSVPPPTDGSLVDWFNVPSGGVSLITSPDYTTPPLTATTTYYVQSSANTCTSLRSRVVVTVNTVPQTPVVTGVTICSSNSATLTATGSTGTYTWYASAASQTALATGATFQTPILTTSATYYVQASNGECVSPRSAVTVNVKAAISSPSASGQIICSGNQASLTASALTGTIQWYNAAAGGNLLSATAAYLTPPLTVSTVYYVQAVSAGCSSTRTAVPVTVLPVVQAPVVPNATICSGTSATLAVKGPYGNFEWYDAATGGNLLSNNQAYITPVLTANATYYVQQTSNGCVSSRTAVTVTVMPIPSAPAASGTQICQGNSVNLTASGPAGTFEWYDKPSAGTLLATGAVFTTPPLIITTTYYVQNTTAQCSSARTAVTVNVINVSTPEFQYPSGSFCISGPDPVPVVNNPAGGTFSAKPSGLTLDPNTGKIDLSTSQLGNYILSFLSNGICSNISTTEIAIVNIPNPKFSYISEFCQDQTNPLPQYPGVPNPGVFSAVPAGLIFNNITTGEINLAKSRAGTYTVTNSIPASGSCPASSASNTVTIILSPTVSAGKNQTVAAGSKVNLAGTYSGTTGVIWSGGLGSFSNPSSPNAVYTPAPGETSITLTLTTKAQPGPCGEKSSSVIITINNTPAAPTAPGTSVCQGNNATLIATAPGGTYQWFDAPTGGNLLATNAVYLTPPIGATTAFYVQTTVGTLTSARTRVTVTLTATPAVPNVTNYTVCIGNTATLVASGSAGTYQWYDAANGGDLLATGSTFITPPIIAGTSYYVQTSVNGCVSGRAKVNVTITPLPEITSVLISKICSGNVFNYTITSNIPASYTWSRAAVPGIGNASLTNQTTAHITEQLVNTSGSPVNVTYVITPILNQCTGTLVNLVVTVDPPVKVTSANAVTVCNATSSDYAIKFSSPPGSFSWSRGQVNGIKNFSVSNQMASTVREQLINTTTAAVTVHYQFIITTAGCPGSVFDLAVTVNPVAHVISPGSGTVCGGVAQNYVIKSDVRGATFTWSRAVVNNISNGAVTNQTSGVINEALINTGASPVPVVYTIIPFADGCTGTPFKYTVTVYPQAANSVANNNSPVCLNSTIKLFTTTIPGATYLWTGPNGFMSALQNPTISNVTKANQGSYYLTITNYGCSNIIPSGMVLVDDFPKADAGPNQNVCTNSNSVKLNGKITGGTTTGVWSTAGTGTFSPASNQLDADYIPSAQDKSAGSVMLTLTSTSKDDCNISMSSTTLTFQPGPTADAGGEIDACSQDLSIQLTGQAANASSVLWTTSGTGTFSPSPYVASPVYFRSATDIQTGFVTLTFHAQSTLCSDEATSTVLLKLIPPPTVNAGKQIFVIKGDPTVLSPQVSDGNVQYSWTPNQNIDNNTIRNPTITVSQDVTYTLTVTDTRGCVSQDQVLVKVIDDLTIPNTFTPNGDGINDVWNIPGLINYPAVTVDIFTRYGQKVFHSNGYGTPWDGNYNGQRLPTGVYYYIIDTQFKNEKLSGYVTLLR